MSRYLLQIPEPCHESWDRMDQCDTGRYCHSCAKEVIDFSKMTDDQVLNILELNPSGFCGRLANHQLNRVMDEKKKNSPRKWLAVLAGISLFGQSEKATAGKTTLAGELPLVIKNSFGQTDRFAQQRTRDKDSTPNSLKGIVVDDKGDPVAFASVMLKGTKIGVATNAEGRFELALKEHYWHGDSITLEISSAGFNSNILYMNVLDPGIGLKIVLLPKEISVTVGAIVTVRKRKWWQIWRRKYY